MEHVDKNGKPLLYLVFEYLDTDLKKFIDVYRKGPNPRPLPHNVIQVFNFGPKNPSFQLIKRTEHFRI